MGHDGTGAYRIYILWGRSETFEVVEHDGELYSLSNRRLFVFRVVAHYRPGFVCNAKLCTPSHYRVRRRRFDPDSNQWLSKWERAMTTRCYGAWVVVNSKFNKKQQNSSWAEPPKPRLQRSTGKAGHGTLQPRTTSGNLLQGFSDLKIAVTYNHSWQGREASN